MVRRFALRAGRAPRRARAVRDQRSASGRLSGRRHRLRAGRDVERSGVSRIDSPVRPEAHAARRRIVRHLVEARDGTEPMKRRAFLQSSALLLLRPQLAPARITTIAGTGMPGSARDGEAADRASINNPFGLVIGPDGALYWADFGSNR